MGRIMNHHKQICRLPARQLARQCRWCGEQFVCSCNDGRRPGGGNGGIVSGEARRAYRPRRCGGDMMICHRELRC
jgi:hypothetical protein